MMVPNKSLQKTKLIHYVLSSLCAPGMAHDLHVEVPESGI